MTNRVRDDSGDRKYWVQTPMLVWALVDDPFSLALWITIKSICGEDRECTLSTEDLATLSMMSVGKVSQCRARLIEVGLLDGEVRKDPEYPQPVWHLVIPDVWATNVEWAKQHQTIRARIAHKALQKAEARKECTEKKSLHHVKAKAKKPSPREGGTSPREGGTSPREGGTSPHEANNNIYRSSKNNKESSSTVHDDEQQRLTKTLSHALQQAGIGLNELIFEQYTELVANYGMESVLRGIQAAVQNNKQHRFRYVQACVISAAQGTTSQPPATGSSKQPADINFKDWLLRTYNTTIVTGLKPESELRHEYKTWRAAQGLTPGG